MHDPAHRWHAADHFSESLMPAPPRSVLIASQRCAALGLPEISVTPSMGRTLHILARLTNATRILEIGTLGGYSTAWMAEALTPGGHIITIELDPDRAAAAQETFRIGGIADRVRVRCGSGLDVLAALEAEHAGPFDLVFIDADKENSGAYFQRTLAMTRPGGIIVVDNVIREGSIADPANTDPRTQGSRDAIARMVAAPNVSATVLQTVGSKGYDGFAIAHVLGPTC